MLLHEYNRPILVQMYVHEMVCAHMGWANFYEATGDRNFEKDYLRIHLIRRPNIRIFEFGRTSESKYLILFENEVSRGA